MPPEIPTVLPDEVSELKEIIKLLSEAFNSLEDKYESTRHRLQLMLKDRYGKRSERFSPGQQLLDFPGIKEALAAAGLTEDDLKLDEDEPLPAPKKRSSHGRRKIPEDLPREEVEHDLPDEEKFCDKCGDALTVIGFEESEQLEWVPGYYKAIKHKRCKYVCRTKGCKCSIKVAVKAETSVYKCLAAAGLLAHIIVSKYDDHLPLYRQQEIINRIGMDINRSTMSDWIRQVVDKLQPIYNLMKQLVLRSKVIQTDDTYVKYQTGRGNIESESDIEGSTKGDANPKSKAKQKKIQRGYIWPYLGDEDYPFVVFDFSTGRGGKHPKAFLGDYRGYLQADAFGGYDALFAKLDENDQPLIREVACWAHARRKFHESLNTSQRELAGEAMTMINGLYDIECDINGKTDEEKKLGRKHRSKPLLNAIAAWLETASTKVIPSYPITKAIRYAQNNWDALNRYTEEGYLNIDNNASERAIKNVVIGRKNWLFAGSETGGHIAAVCYTLIESAKRAGANPEAWLKFVIENIASTPKDRLSELLPDQWVRSQQESIPST
ncbi:MAG: IS66 family transposase [Planctomycetota bacterium]